MLFRNVNQDGTSGHDVHRFVSQLTKVLRNSTDEVTSIREAELIRSSATDCEEIVRNVAEDHPFRSALERAESQQSFAATNIENHIALKDPRSIQDLVPNDLEPFEHLSPDLSVAS